MRLYNIWCQSLTGPCGLPCQPPSTPRRAARCTLKSASVDATQAFTLALPPPRGGRSPSGTPRSDILRNSTAIQRVLPMAARRAHKSERGERRRGASRDGGLRRGVARRTCRSQRQQPPRRVSRARAGGKGAASPAAGIAPKFATRDALAKAPRVADRSAAVRVGTGRIGARPAGRASPDVPTGSKMVNFWRAAARGWWRLTGTEGHRRVLYNVVDELGHWWDTECSRRGAVALNEVISLKHPS